MSPAPKPARAASGDAVRSAALSSVEGARKAAGTLRDFHDEERLGRAYDTQLLRRLWPFMKPHARYLGAQADAEEGIRQGRGRGGGQGPAGEGVLRRIRNAA